MEELKPVFWVKDKHTSKEANLEEVVLESYKGKTWASNLVYCDIESWAIDTYGELLVTDECGNFAYAPMERFEIIWNTRAKE